VTTAAGMAAAVRGEQTARKINLQNEINEI